jgi:hypothetical protein
MRILHINKKSGDEGLGALESRLKNRLHAIGLRGYGRIGQWETAGDRFPSTYVVESEGEGGFVIEYESREVLLQEGGRARKLVDASLIPVGAMGSLVQRVYSYLKETENCTEAEFSRR